MIMGVIVKQAGLLTTVQDSGRWGYQHLGVPVAGAMDIRSHRLANLLVGNDAGSATLEVTVTGPELWFDAPTVFAVTGAAFGLQLDGEDIPPDTSCAAEPQSTLTFGQRRSGARAYLAVAGGFEVPVVLGSRSTHIGSGMGGLLGRALRVGDRLEVGGSWRQAAPERSSAPRDEVARRRNPCPGDSGAARRAVFVQAGHPVSIHPVSREL